MSTTMTGLARGVPEPKRRRKAWLAGPPALALLAVSGIALIAALPQQPQHVAHTVAERELRVVHQPDGSLQMVDTASGAIAGTVPAQGDSFVRGVIAGIDFQRRHRAVPDTTPLHLTGLDDGRLVLTDPATATTIHLEAFGIDNLESFARMLDRKDPPR